MLILLYLCQNLSVKSTTQTQATQCTDHTWLNTMKGQFEKATKEKEYAFLKLAKEYNLYTSKWNRTWTKTNIINRQ